ncbi:capsular biosynthesis protein [Pigmentiphaga aceris]|uniref:Capsular biosynthesis protein n=1 Tax=Pigmentiphaga aceris TaxID=1940612 RepID=A0A5C0B3V2_9BURK|nr:capsular biosynthesis protein [Pigmentiphaga aceris]QEI07920.1 capsular biosynthesis protein [Pigmentiphaga aceris]
MIRRSVTQGWLSAGWLQALLAGSLISGAACAAAPANFSTTADGTAFYPFAIDEDALTGAPDMSRLNQPLTPAAKITARDGHFWSVGADGKPGTADDARVRLFGASLSFSANFPTAADAPRLASRLRKLGFNAVRLHHLDSLPGTATAPPNSILTPGPYPSFNPEAVNRLKNLIGALSAQGIYVNLNLRVGYRFRPDVDQVPALPADAPTGASAHSYWPRMIELQERYARELIRALGLRGNPALAMVEISNESSLVWAWQQRKWAAMVPPAYSDELLARWQTWLVQRYGSIGQACTAWDTCPASQTSVPLLSPDDAVGGDRMIDGVQRRVGRMADRLFGNDKSKPTGAALRTQDFLSFLADTDRVYFDRLRRVVHEETDTQVPVTGTQMAFGGVSNFDANAGMDYIDEHFYVDHPESGPDWQRDWYIRNLAATGDAMQRIQAISFRRDSRKPFVVSEFNQPYPNRHGAEILPVMAIVASMQDWDGLFFFDYAQEADWPKAPTSFSLTGNWGQLALAGQSAAVFREAQATPLSTRLDIPLGPDARRAIAADPSYGALEAYLANKQDITSARGWRESMAIKLDPSASAATNVVAKPVAPYSSPDEQVRFDPQRQVLEFRGKQSWGVFGTPGDARVGDDALGARVAASPTQYATLLVTALDAQPLPDSRRLLVTVGGATTGTQPGSQPLRPKGLVRHRAARDTWAIEPDPAVTPSPSGPRASQAPAWVSRTETTLDWRTPARSLTVYPLNGAGKRQAPMAGNLASIDNGRATIRLHTSAALASPWYEVVLEGNR